MSNPQVSAAMIMTAGLGTRLHPFTQVQTKALMPVFGVPSAQFVIDTLVAAGVSQIIANLHHRASDTQKGLLKLDLAGSSLLLSDESQELLGTAGGMRKVLPHIGKGPLLRANADVLCNIDWLSLLDRHQYLKRKRGVSITLALLKNTHPSEQYPEILLHSDQESVMGVGKAIPSGVFWSGAAVLEREAFADVPDQGASEFVPSILRPALQKQSVGAVVMNSCWYDIGTPQLWLQTHFDLMSELESVTSSSGLLPQWRERLLQRNLQIKPGVWVDRRVPRFDQIPVRAPSYVGWSGEAPFFDSSFPYQELGPRCVVYGGAVSQGVLQRGIGYSKFWIGEG